MSLQHEQDVLDTLDVFLAVIREVKPDGNSQYTISLKEDSDKIIPKTNSKLAELHDGKKIGRELRIVGQHLHSGDCVVWRAEAKDENHPAGKQSCHDKIRDLLMNMALERKYKDDEPGRVMGHNAEEIEKLTPEQLEEFRKAVCSQTTGGVQLENKILYYLGNNLNPETSSGAATFAHKVIGKRFREGGAIWKDPEARRTYHVQFAERKVTNEVKSSRKDLKDHAVMATKRREEAAKKALEKKAKEAAAKAAKDKKTEAKGKKDKSEKPAKKPEEAMPAEPASTS